MPRDNVTILAEEPTITSVVFQVTHVEGAFCTLFGDVVPHISGVVRRPFQYAGIFVHIIPPGCAVLP